MHDWAGFHLVDLYTLNQFRRHVKRGLPKCPMNLKKTPFYSRRNQIRRAYQAFRNPVFDQKKTAQKNLENTVVDILEKNNLVKRGIRSNMVETSDGTLDSITYSILPKINFLPSQKKKIQNEISPALAYFLNSKKSKGYRVFEATLTGLPLDSISNLSSAISTMRRKLNRWNEKGRLFRSHGLDLVFVSVEFGALDFLSFTPHNCPTHFLPNLHSHLVFVAPRGYSNSAWTRFISEFRKWAGVRVQGEEVESDIGLARYLLKAILGTKDGEQPLEPSSLNAEMVCAFYNQTKKHRLFSSHGSFSSFRREIERFRKVGTFGEVRIKFKFDYFWNSKGQLDTFISKNFAEKRVERERDPETPKGIAKWLFRGGIWSLNIFGADDPRSLLNHLRRQKVFKKSDVYFDQKDDKWGMPDPHLSFSDSFLLDSDEPESISKEFRGAVEAFKKVRSFFDFTKIKEFRTLARLAEGLGNKRHYQRRLDQLLFRRDQYPQCRPFFERFQTILRLIKGQVLLGCGAGVREIIRERLNPLTESFREFVRNLPPFVPAHEKNIFDKPISPPAMVAGV